MSRSEAVVIESIEVAELLRFLFYLDILNKLLLLLCKHLKYMYSRCLNFPCFINYLAACMHASILHVLSVRLTRIYSGFIKCSFDNTTQTVFAQRPKNFIKLLPFRISNIFSQKEVWTKYKRSRLFINNAEKICPAHLEMSFEKNIIV